jgi:signal transduction histidine kinase
VAGYLQVLLDGEVGELTAGQSRIAEIAARNAERLERLVDDLIAVAQVQAGGIAAARGPVDLPGLVRERARHASPRATARGVSLQVCSGTCPEVTGDLPALTQMVDHMLEHAVMFSMPGGRIEVRVLPGRRGGVDIEVWDDGMTMGADDLPALMDGRTAAGGASPRALLASRIGLYLVRAVAEAHGGTACASGDGASTTLTVSLPA